MASVSEAVAPSIAPPSLPPSHPRHLQPTADQEKCDRDSDVRYIARRRRRRRSHPRPPSVCFLWSHSTFLPFWRRRRRRRRVIRTHSFLSLVFSTYNSYYIVFFPFPFCLEWRWCVEYFRRGGTYAALSDPHKADSSSSYPLPLASLLCRNCLTHPTIASKWKERS